MAYPEMNFSINQTELDNLFFEEHTSFGRVWDDQQREYACNEGFDLRPDFLQFDPFFLPNFRDELNKFEDIPNELWGVFDQPQVHNEANLVNPSPIMDNYAQNGYVVDGVSLSDFNVEVVDMELRSKCNKTSALQLEEIQKYFDVPITRAAKKLNVGLTVLKKRCRELNIMRWPHRKIKSLKFLIHNVKELGLTNEIEMLEEHKRMVEKIPEMELTERTKKLRQACFKANYKKRKSMQMQTHLALIS